MIGFMSHGRCYELSAREFMVDISQYSCHEPQQLPYTHILWSCANGMVDQRTSCSHILKYCGHMQIDMPDQRTNSFGYVLGHTE